MKDEAIKMKEYKTFFEALFHRKSDETTIKVTNRYINKKKVKWNKKPPRK